MEQNDLNPANEDYNESGSVLVAFLGFSSEDEESFNRFFQVARLDKPKYVAALPSEKASSDILMVNYDSPSALIQRDELLARHPSIQIVAVSRGLLDNPPEHHIRGMLFAARVLTTLDRVVPKQKSEPPQGFVETLSKPTAEVYEHQPQTSPIDRSVSALDDIQARAIAPEQQTRVFETKPHIQPVIVESASPMPSIVNQASAVVGYRTLVVDDSVAIQKSIELNLAILTQISEIDFAESGEVALEKAAAKQYDLIFLDVMMPGIDGYETCTRLRKQPEYKKTPIIMVSGKTSPLDEVKGVMAGCTTYLTKPVQQDAFQKLSIRVLSWLEKQKKP